ncbi:MAG: DUF6488 family protein [Mariprofundaceae bacterium]|nr:DUF6488 family protein [Mariprofundaceae bacterium]
MQIKTVFLFFIFIGMMIVANCEESAAQVSTELLPQTKPLPQTKAVAHNMNLQAVAIGKVKQLIEKGVIDESWQSDVVLKSVQLEKKEYHDKEGWVVRFENHDRQKNPAKKSLYVFLKPSGDYLSVSFKAQ